MEHRGTRRHAGYAARGSLVAPRAHGLPRPEEHLSHTRPHPAAAL